MKISNINFLNFKGLYYVQARKDMFKKPNQPLECESEFRDMIDFASNMYGSKPKEFTVYLESPGHEMALRALKKTTFSNCSVPWLNKNAKTRIFEGLKDGYYSFFVATDKDADEFSVLYEKKSLIKAVRNFSKIVNAANIYQETDKKLDVLQQFARLLDEEDESFFEDLKGRRKLLVKADSPDELVCKLSLNVVG